MEDIVDMDQGYGGTTLEYCFAYQGIDQHDNINITNVVGSMSNRLRAECDAILKPGAH